MNNHVIGLEDTFGTFKWELADKMSKSLREHPEDRQRKYLAFYTEVLSAGMHFIVGVMQLPPALQEKYVLAYLEIIKELAKEGIKEVKKYKEREL